MAEEGASVGLMVSSTIQAFVEENRIVLAAFTALGALLFLAEETISASKQRRSFFARTFRVLGLLAVLQASIHFAWSVPLEHVPIGLQGKTYLVTGCTPGGIGYETARVLLEWNATNVICTMRTAEKAEALKASMVGAGPGKFNVVVMELTSFDSVRAAAKEINSKYSKLDGVMLNAGLMTSETKITKDGFEEMFQVNHLSQFLLLRLIEDRLLSPARVVFTSSAVYFFLGYLDREAYSKKPGGRTFINDVFTQAATYADTKLMNILTANAFAKRLSQRNVYVNSLCPGLVATSFQERMPNSFGTFIASTSAAIVGRSARQGAMRGLHILTNPKHETTTATFFDSYVRLPVTGQVNEDNEKWLYETSERLVGLA